MKTKEAKLFLAPMAGAGDRAFRESCAPFGVDFFCTEMISAKALHFGDEKSLLLAETGKDERPIAVQIFGSEPGVMAEAAVKLSEISHCDGIDLNFGCPVPKIVRGGDGSALMRDPEKCYEITKEVCGATKLPVSVKIRAGWDGDHLNAPLVAALCEKAGASRIAVHGRTREDLYREGTVRPEVIREVKKAVSIPVIGNGDVRDGESALHLLEETGCDGLMIGRAALGAPWVFAEIREALTGEMAPPFSKIDVIRRHVALAFSYKGARAGKELRMHLVQYLKGFPGAAALRRRASCAATPEDYALLLLEMEKKGFH